MNAYELETFINERRDSGEITLRIFNDPTPSDAGVVQQYAPMLEKCGFEKCERLCEIDQPMAEKILVSFMHREMAYRCRCIPFEEAGQLAQQFFSFFKLPETRFFTNASFEEWIDPIGHFPLLSLSSTFSVAPSTFETGVVAISAATQGIFWFEDED